METKMQPPRVTRSSTRQAHEREANKAVATCRPTENPGRKTRRMTMLTAGYTSSNTPSHSGGKSSAERDSSEPQPRFKKRMSARKSEPCRNIHQPLELEVNQHHVENSKTDGKDSGDSFEGVVIEKFCNSQLESSSALRSPLPTVLDIRPSVTNLTTSILALFGLYMSVCNLAIVVYQFVEKGPTSS